MPNFSGTKKPTEVLRRGPGWMRQAFSALSDRVTASAPITTADMAVVSSARGKILLAGAKKPDFPARIVPPFQIGPTGKVTPGSAGGMVPTLDGEPISTTTNVIDLTSDGGNFVCWFKFTWTTTFDTGFLTSGILSAVEIGFGTELPDDDSSIKYLEFCAVVDGAPTLSYFRTSISVQLIDNGSGQTAMVSAYF